MSAESMLGRRSELTPAQIQALPRNLLDVACRIRGGETLIRDDELVDGACHALNDALDEIARLQLEVERLRAEAAKSERRAIEYSDLVARQAIVMRAAVVAWHRSDAATGMRWIANTLYGPGHLPSDADIALGDQALFDREIAELESFRAAHPAPKIEGPTPRHVVKAEGSGPDATDRGRSAMASPGGGPTGVGQPAAAGPGAREAMAA